MTSADSIGRSFTFGGRTCGPAATRTGTGGNRKRRARPLAALSLAALLLATGAGCSSARRAKADQGPFAAYPASPALSAIIDTHKQAGADPQDERALVTTWFLDGDPRVAMMCSVQPTGHVSAYRFVHDYSIQPGRPLAELVAAQMADLAAAVGRLPPSQRPTLDNLLIVSFRQATDGAWVTRTYDRTDPPPAVVDLFLLTNAPLQPDPRQKAEAGTATAVR